MLRVLKDVLPTKQAILGRLYMHNVLCACIIFQVYSGVEAFMKTIEAKIDIY